MKQVWNYHKVPIKLQLGDKTLLAPELWLQVRQVGLDDEIPPVAEPVPPADPLQKGSQGFLIRSLPIIGEQPVMSRRNSYLCYISSQYPRYYIDMRQSFEEYKKKFSSKSRSTFNRKVRKYAEHCGGNISWRIYKATGEMREFYELARAVSRITYQETLLDAGLPDSKDFLHDMEQRAQQGEVRAFILFHRNEPVSYLYCPIDKGVLIYAFLGYDPEYANFSVGTVLQWLALEYLFKEESFRFFDFTEGQSEHKRLFATHSVQCANVFFLRSSLRNMLLLNSQRTVNYLSKSIGDTLHQFGLKTRVRKLIRFGG